MATIACPQCGELNEQNAIHCVACGARMDEPVQPKPVPFGKLINENVRNLAWLAAGVILLGMGLYAPWLGSAIIQLILSFTQGGRSSRFGSSQYSAADQWLVLGVAGLCLLIGGVGLYQSMRKFWARKLGAADPDSQDTPGE